MKSVPRVLFMGTPDFAVPSLSALVRENYDVLVVTQPDKPVGRKRVVTPPPVKRVALEYGLPVLQPDKVKSSEALAEISNFQPDVLVTAAYGQLLPKRLLDLPRVGAVNVHASLLPRWRGAAPIHRALLSGDKQTGVTLMEMVLALDAGPMLGSVVTDILLSDNVGTLHDRLAGLGADLLCGLLPDYLAGRLEPVPQAEEGVTYAERIVREDEFVDFTRHHDEVFNHIRGLSPWPGATATCNGNLLKIWAASLFDEKVLANPGAVVVEQDGIVTVQCGTGRLQLLEVQPAGKRKMAAIDWVRGFNRESILLERVQSE